MSPITTHVLDTALGKPAVGVHVTLSRVTGGETQSLAQGVTNDDGRITDWLPEGPLEEGQYEVRFETEPYFAASGRDCFYPGVTILFTLADATAHYHVPLLLSPYGYTTYRGS
jgi:5-hydroxyisourate hydrolase